MFSSQGPFSQGMMLPKVVYVLLHQLTIKFYAQSWNKRSVRAWLSSCIRKIDCVFTNCNYIYDWWMEVNCFQGGNFIFTQQFFMDDSALLTLLDPIWPPPSPHSSCQLSIHRNTFYPGPPMVIPGRISKPGTYSPSTLLRIKEDIRNMQKNTYITQYQISEPRVKIIPNPDARCQCKIIIHNTQKNIVPVKSSNPTIGDPKRPRYLSITQRLQNSICEYDKEP